MSPELAQKLMGLPEGRELKAFLLSEANKLNRLDDIKFTDPNEIALEAKSRQRAYEVVKEMLSTLLDSSENDIMNSKDESITTEMLQEERSSTNKENNGN